MDNTKVMEMAVETLAELIQTCVAVDDIVECGKLTPDILGELENIRPVLRKFATTEYFNSRAELRIFAGMA